MMVLLQSRQDIIRQDKINDTIEFKAGSLSYGKIVDYEEESNMYSVELKSGSKIRCTEHYIKGERVVEADE